MDRFRPAAHPRRADRRGDAAAAARPRGEQTIVAAGLTLPVYRADCLVVGSAARPVSGPRWNLRGVASTWRWLSQSAWGGTSACSGSDKQTIHTANTADRGDDFRAMAAAIAAGGAMDEDTAYIEAVGRSGRWRRSSSGPAAPAGSSGRHAALPDRPRRGGPRHKLRPAHLAPDGQGAGRGGVAPGRPDLQPDDPGAADWLRGPAGHGAVCLRARDRRRATLSGSGVFLAPVAILAAAGRASSTATASIPTAASGCSGSRSRRGSRS
jgi:succinate dehydrogenase / fumarate reductase, flavoprotein subunit